MTSEKAQRLTSAPRLLDQLASLTSIRDLELIEISLLKTLHGLLSPTRLSLVRLNSKGVPIMEIVYGDDQCTVHQEELTLTREMQEADNHIQTYEMQYHTVAVDRGVMVVFALTSTRVGRSYLQITCDKPMSNLDSHLISGVLQIYRNFFSLMQHSQTDELTGLANRKTFDDCVAKVHDLIPLEFEPVDCERRSTPAMNYWLVMVDIDHFKLVNDRFGHLYGDEVLVILAQQMKASFREDDMMFRFGGEEFVLIIRCMDQATCRATLERFRHEVETRSIPQVGHITVSLGVTRMSRATFTATMIDYADKAMYHSKHHGRNQVTFFEDLVARGLQTEEDFKAAEISFF